jgi:glucose-6-phosphate-specific signal transduction histidine kinase
MHLPPGDISPLLASLRYRLELRLTACGIELDWAVDVRGLRLMQERAQAIGAKLKIHSQPGRSAVELWLG